MPTREELALIQALLEARPVSTNVGVGLFLMPDRDLSQVVFDAAVAPAMQRNGLSTAEVTCVFNSHSSLNQVIEQLLGAEVVIADVTGPVSDLMYVLGLAHGFGRCPILIGRTPLYLPFNLEALRCIAYEDSLPALHELRENLTRALRVFLAMTRQNPMGL